MKTKLIGNSELEIIMDADETARLPFGMANGTLSAYGRKTPVYVKLNEKSDSYKVTIAGPGFNDCDFILVQFQPSDYGRFEVNGAVTIMHENWKIRFRKDNAAYTGEAVY